MEFDLNISKLQGAILSLRRRGFLSEASPSIAELKELKTRFESTTDEDVKLKMCFFMILNTDLTISEILTQNENLCPLICISPPLEKRLTMKLMWELKLMKYFCVILENCSSGITDDLLAVLVNEVLKNANEMSDLCQLWCSLFKKIHNIHIGFQEDKGAVKMSLIFDRMYKIIEEKLLSFKNVDMTEQAFTIGQHFITFFRSLLFMVRLCNDSTYKPEKNDLFDGTTDLHLYVSMGLLEPSKTCLNIVFQTVHLIFDVIGFGLRSVLYATPAEVDSSVSAGEIIGELCYYIRRETQDVAPKLLECFEVYQNPPISELEKLMRNEDKAFDLSNWIDALTSYLNAESEKSGKDGAPIDKVSSFDPFENENFIERVTENLASVDGKLLKGIVEKCKNLLLEKECQHEGKLRTLLLKALAEAEDVDYEDLLKQFFDVHPEVGAKFELAESNSEVLSGKLTRTFNQNSNEKYPKMSDLVCLCLESREKTLYKICKTAAFGSPVQLEFFCKVLQGLKNSFNDWRGVRDEKRFSVSVLENVIETIIREGNFSERDEEGFVLFLTKIQELELVDWSLHHKILSILNNEMKARRYEGVIFGLKLLRTGFSLKTVDKFRFVLIVYLAQVLERFAWDLESYSALNCRGTELADQIISKVISDEKEKQAIVPRDIEWILREIDCFSEMTQARFSYFRLLGNRQPPTSLPNLLFSLIYTEQREKLISRVIDGEPETDVRQSIILSLAMILPRLTSDLWTAMFEVLKEVRRKMSGCPDSPDVDYDVIDYFSSAIYLLTLCLNDNPNIFPCYEFCLRNYGGILRMCDSKVLGSHSNSILMKTFFFLQAIESCEERERGSLTVVPTLLEILKKSKRWSQNELHSTFDKLIDTLGLVTVKEAILRKLDGLKIP